MTPEAQRDQLLSLVGADETAMALLRLAHSLDLPDWAIGAGFLRNRLWDDLTGAVTCSPADDVDPLMELEEDARPARWWRARA